MTDEKTHFGFKDVPKEQKQGMVKDVFDSVADQYDLMNDLMSFGIHRLWKKHAIRSAQLRKHQTILDLAAGTCDLTAQIYATLKGQAQIYASDINASMLNKGYDRLLDQGIHQNIHFVQANAECLPFSSHTFDRVFIGFGLRNVTDKAKALKSIYASLKPGGQLIVLEFSHCTQPMLAKIYDQYSFKLLPKLGQLFANDGASYRYLAESIRKHEDQETLQKMFLASGFDDCQYQNICFGVVSIHKGFKY